MYYSDRDLRGVKIKDGYQNLIQNRSGILTDGQGSSIDSLLSTSSWSNNSISSSWAPQNQGGGTTLYTGSSYPITASWSIYVNGNNVVGTVTSASYATSASYNYINTQQLNTTSSLFSSQSLYSTQSIYSVSASWASSSISASWAPTVEAGTTIITGSTYSITSSWSNNVISASWAITASFSMNGGSSLNTGSTYSITSSWSDNSMSSSYITQSNIKIDNGNLYVLSNLGDWWKLSIFDDGSGNATIQLDT